MQTSLFDTKIKRKAKKSSEKSGDIDTLNMSIAPIAIEEASSGVLEKVLGVSDYLDYINEILKVTGDIKVLGEISRLSQHPTGIYLTLKDKQEEGVLDCYINPYTYRGLGLQLEEGMEVKITGIPGIFKRRSQLSFRVENVELAGEGTLKKAYELLKQKLEQEGMFDRKRELPEFISCIGVITSKTGAVIDDFRNNLELLGCRMFFKDCRVEGAQSANQIIQAIKYFNTKHPELDCLVLMRGGGSLEDLQAFNNELVVKEMFASRIPIIAAIGHDRDVPLACLVADRYTSTPTAAAMLINSTWQRLRNDLPRLERTILHQFDFALSKDRSRLSNLSHQLTGSFHSILQRYQYFAEKIMRGAGQIQNTIHSIRERSLILLDKCNDNLARAIQSSQDIVMSTEKLLTTANPERNLKLGYSLAYDAKGKLVRSSKDVQAGKELNIKLHKGSLTTQVINSNQ
jgi:exodeoxyribonuclease VII large subunit